MHATHKYVDFQVAAAKARPMAVGDLQKAVGAYLRRYRQERSLSQEAFAELLGVHRTYMGGIERGERNLTLQNIERLAEKLGVGVMEMLRG